MVAEDIHGLVAVKEGSRSSGRSMRATDYDSTSPKSGSSGDWPDFRLLLNGTRRLFHGHCRA